MFTVDELYTNIRISDIEAVASELDIFKKYCSNFTELNKDFKSEFYDDKKPDCRVYISDNGKLKYHDFGAKDDHFNCYTYVMRKYSCNFRECLKIIANDFNIKGTSEPFNMQPNTNFTKERVVHFPYVPKVKPIIKIVSRNWNLTDYEYWYKQYKISFEWLMSYNVIPCQYVYLQKGQETTVFTESKVSPIYAYKFIFEGVVSYKIYFPLSTNKKFKWLFSGITANNIEGFDQLPDKDDLLIITKSLKDVICCRLCGYSAISLQGEGNKLSTDLFNKLNSRFIRFIVLYDNDDGGKEGSAEMVKKYGFKSIIIPPEYECKDLAELIAKIGLKEAKTVLESIL